MLAFKCIKEIQLLINLDPLKKIYVVSDNIKLTEKSFIRFFEEASLLSKHNNAVLSSVEVGQLYLEYYDNCLANYCRQRKDLGIQHKDTCWIKNCEDIISLGPQSFCKENVNLLYPKSRPNGLLSKFIRWCTFSMVRYDEDGWVFLRFLPPLDFTLKGLVVRIKYWIVTFTGLRGRDRVLDIVDSIIKHGWCNSRATWPHPSVLIYHRLTKKFSVHTGRHRIAAARYLYEEGRLSGNQIINAVVISVPWGAMRTGRPYPGVARCEECIK